METPERKMLSKSKPKQVQQKTMRSIHKVLKERRLCRAQAFVNAEAKAPERKSNLKRKAERVENKPVNSANDVQKKRRLMEGVRDQDPAQQNPERKLAVKQKPEFVEKPTTLAHGEGRVTETKNQQEKNIDAEVLLKSTGKAGEKKRKLILRIKLSSMTATLVDGDERLAEARNQQEENVRAEICLKTDKEAEEKKRILHDYKKIKVDKERRK